MPGSVATHKGAKKHGVGQLSGEHSAIIWAETDGVHVGGSPDGIGPHGAFMTYSNSPNHLENFCVQWGSVGPALGMLQCDERYSVDAIFTCTKAAVIHVHLMSRKAGVLVLKRMHCTAEKCSVFKVN